MILAPLLLVLAGGLVADLAEDEKAVSGLREQLVEAQARLKRSEERLAELRPVVDGELAEIKRLKQEAGKGFLKERKLEALLKRSRDGIKELERLKGEQEAAGREVLKYAAALLVMYNRLIDEALRSRQFARQEGASLRLANWIIERQRYQQLYFDLRAEEDAASETAPRLLAIETARGQEVGLAREILEVQIELIGRELLLLEEQLEDYRTERSHWLRLRRFMHEMSRRRGDPLMDDVAPHDELGRAGDVLSQGRDIEKIEAEIKRFEGRRDTL